LSAHAHTYTKKYQESTMQFIPFGLFVLICSYSLVNSAPVNQAAQETKQQKATAIANRLLKELAGEKLPSDHQEQSETKDENKDTIVTGKHHAVEKVQPHIDNQKNDIIANDDEDIDYIPTMDDLYEIYGDKYAQLADDEDLSPESNDDDYILPVSAQQLMRYLAEQEESDEHLAPVIHTPVMDDRIMTAEDHQQRRRRRSIY